jgi:hypothetical protein
MPFGLVLLGGKFLFIAALYIFLLWAFRGLFRQMGLERQAAGQAARRPLATAPAVARPAMAGPAMGPAPMVVASATPLADDSPVLSAMEHQPARARLVVRDPGGSRLLSGQVIELTAALTIGRADDNGLVIEDRFCSAHHALVFLHEGQRVLRDTGSTNGTFHNGRRLTGDVVLEDHDRINFGTVALEYRAPVA